MKPEKERHNIVAFCQTCGQLDVKDGVVLHPERDRLIRKTYELGMVASYTGSETERKKKAAK